MFTHHRLSIKSSGKCSLLEDSMGQSYRDLIAWQKSMDFVMDVYRATKAFPRDEVYGLASQLRRASVLVPTYVAEGQSRLSGNDFYNYLGRARGALVEVETQLLIAQNLGLPGYGSRPDSAKQSGRSWKDLERTSSLNSAGSLDSGT